MNARDRTMNQGGKYSVISRPFRSSILVFVLLLTSLGFAKSSSHVHSSAGPYYGGGHHAESHEGRYSGGTGSSHKGGHYQNSRTGNRYGHHK
jgi:hypothetical protein